MNTIKLNSISLNGNSLNGAKKIGSSKLSNIIKMQLQATEDAYYTIFGDNSVAKDIVEYVKINNVLVPFSSGYALKKGNNSILIKIKDNVETFSYLFSNSKVNRISFINLDMSKVTIFRGMFYNTANLEYVNLHALDTSSAIDMYAMFINYPLSKIDISSLDTSKCLDFTGMFQNTKLTEIDISNFVLADGVNIRSLFYASGLLQKINMPIDIKKQSDFSSTFYNCYSLRELNAPYNWAKGNIPFSSSYQLSPLSIHLLIERAIKGTQRKLTLHADAKANWMASEYYDADVVMANEKLITIA